MTIKASGSLAMSEINAEFGLGNNLNAYRGVTWWTDAGGTGTFDSTNIDFAEFYGKRATSPAGPTNFGGTIYVSRLFTSPAIAGVQFSTNGNIDRIVTGTVFTDTINDDTWYAPATTSIGNSYWIRATLSSGSTPSTGTMNSWLALSTARQWQNSQTFTGSRTSTVLFEISSNSSGTVIVASGTITMQADFEA